MDAFVSVLVILALIIGSQFPSCAFLDPLSGIIGSLVVINWAYVLVYDTTCNLLDLVPDEAFVRHLLKRLEADGSTVADLHVWRLGPGHLGAIISIEPPAVAVTKHDEVYYKQRIKGFSALSHTTIEVCRRKQASL